MRVLSTPDLAGRALDARYELHAVIGEGAFGRVYRGFDKRLERSVAVKVIKPWWAEDGAWVERFQREARLLARVNDPGIVQIFDIGHAQEGPYYVAELVEGESLADRLRRAPMTVAESRRVAEMICEALASAHAQGIVHCDVKPANVLLGNDGSIKIGDFGVARLAEGTSQAMTATVAGTPRYMSPEQARGLSATAPADVYSVGVVLYEMLAGEPPFPEGSPVELGLRHVQDPPPPLPARVPPVLRTIVLRALEKDPGRRYRDCAEMAAALAGASSSTVARSPAPRTEERTETSNTPPDATAVTAALADATSTGGVAETRGPAVRTRLMPKPPSPPPDAPRNGRKRPSRRARIGLVAAFAIITAGAALLLVGVTGPQHVKVPSVLGQPAASAEAVLARTGLRYYATQVASPGASQGSVTRQSPGPGSTSLHGSTVALSVAEAPRWRALTSFSGVDDGRSVPFRIRGSRWRVTYRMGYEGTCLLLFVCFGPSATVENLQTDSTFDGFELNEGSSETHSFDSGPGLYRLAISGGKDPAQWAMTVDDYY